MQLKVFALAGFTGLAAAQSLLQALNSSSDLSNITQIIQSQPALVSALSNATNVTVLAPNNAAVSAFLNSSAAAAVQADQNLLAAVLSYHILMGTYANFSSNATFIPTSLMQGQYAQVSGGQRVEVQGSSVYSGLRDNSTIVDSAINFTGGVIHTINKILTVPEPISNTSTALNLTSFYGALNASQNLATVDSLSDVTVFVPNNEAFQAIGSALPNLTVANVTKILTYHIINGTVAYSNMLKNETVPSLQGNNLTITVYNSSSVYVNSAKVVLPNVLVANGVIHVIDEVLNPDNTAAPSGTQTAGMPAFSGASSVTDQPYTSGQPTPTSSINTAAIASSATGAASTSSKGAAWAPRPTGAVGAAALGGLALLLQL